MSMHPGKPTDDERDSAAEAFYGDQLQAVADRSLRKIALQYGSTTLRDFRVIEIVLGELFGSGNQGASAKPSDSTRRSEAP